MMSGTSSVRPPEVWRRHFRRQQRLYEELTQSGWECEAPPHLAPCNACAACSTWDAAFARLAATADEQSEEGESNETARDEATADEPLEERSHGCKIVYPFYLQSACNECP